MMFGLHFRQPIHSLLLWMVWPSVKLFHKTYGGFIAPIFLLKEWLKVGSRLHLSSLLILRILFKYHTRWDYLVLGTCSLSLNEGLIEFGEENLNKLQWNKYISHIITQGAAVFEMIIPKIHLSFIWLIHAYLHNCVSK